jgi:hypothetical protein
MVLRCRECSARLGLGLKSDGSVMSFHSSRTDSARKDANQGSFKPDGIRWSDSALFDLCFASAEPYGTAA